MRFLTRAARLWVASYFPTFDFQRSGKKISDEVKSPAIFVEVEGPSGKVEDWIFSSNQYATWYTDNTILRLFMNPPVNRLNILQ